MLLASAVTTLLGYLFVPADQGHGWGFRYFHSAWVALPILAAAALTRRPGMTDPTRAFEDDDSHTFVLGCVLLTLIAGVGLRAKQIHEFVADDLTQLPAYSGTERRVVIINTDGSFYGDDLVQNEPRLRGNVIRMVSHGADADARMMHEHFPELRQVYRAGNGTVWSAAPARIADAPR